MKKLLFIGIVALMVQSLGAVTLPSTSYNPYSISTPSSEGSFTLGVGTMVTGSYSSLGVGDSECSLEKTFNECTACCLTNLDNCCKESPIDCDPECLSTYTSCVNDCGRSLPLDGGLLILLVLSLAGGAAKLLRNRRVNS